MPEAATVTMSVEELAGLVKHANSGHYFFNLPRSQRDRQDQYHRCVRIYDLYQDNSGDPTFAFEYQENNSRVATVQHTLRDLFETLPLMRAFLREQRGTSKVIPGELMTDVIAHLELQNMDKAHVVPLELLQALRSL
jgi:hypothetical protein